MIQEEMVWIKNRRAFMIVIGSLLIVFICGLFLTGVMPLVFIDFEGCLSILPVIAIPFIILGILIIPFVRIVPFRVGCDRSKIIFKGLFSWRGKVIQMPEISLVRYTLSRKELQKQLQKRLCFVDVERECQSKIRKLCDGPVVAQLMKTVPRDRSKLVVVLSGGKTEEREVSESDWA